MSFLIDFIVDGRSATLTYEEGDHRLEVGLDMSGVPEFDWVGTDESLRTWTRPLRDPIEANHQAEIKARILDWSRTRRIRIDISPGVSAEAIIEQFRASGWSVENTSDGVRLARPKVKGGG